MRKNLILIFLVIFSVTLLSSTVFASQALPRYGINEKTKECSEFYMGDECGTCVMPEGWEMIDEFECPGGYAEIQARSDCTPSKTPFCCTVSHSGANGDCEDVVVNDIEKKCAFVEDIGKCDKIPANWKKAEEFMGERLCPFVEYEWLEESVECEARVIAKDDVDDNNDSIRDDKRQEFSIAPTIVILVFAIILSVILWLFIIKRKQN
jgi:hypothetical protein